MLSFYESLAKSLAILAGIHIKAAHAIKITEEQHRHGHRPAVDVLFESLAHVISVALTHMGSDGLNVKRNRSGSINISEAQESSIVYGSLKQQ